MVFIGLMGLVDAELRREVDDYQGSNRRFQVNYSLMNAENFTGNRTTMTNNITSTTGWFNGLFNWTVSFTNKYIFGSFNGNILNIEFNQTLNNDTIQDLSLNNTEANTIYLNLSGTNANQNLVLNPFTMRVPTPVFHNDTANKGYVDDAVAGINFDFFLNDGESDIINYFNMTEDDLDVAESSLTSPSLPIGTTTIFNFTTLDGQPEFSTLIGGIYDAHIHFDKSGPGTRDVKIFWELYNRTGTQENLLLTSEHSSSLTQIQNEFDIHGVLGGERMLNSGDRLILKLIANVTGGGSNPTVTISMQGTTDSHFTVQTTTGAFGRIYLRQDATTPLLANWDAVKNITADTFFGSGSFLTGIATGNIFDQILNTTNNVQFANITSTGNLTVTKDVLILENLIVDGGDIGISADTDLLQLINNELDINGDLLVIGSIFGNDIQADPWIGTEGEEISNLVGGQINFTGTGGGDNTDIAFDLDGVRPRIFSPTDSVIEISETVFITGTLDVMGGTIEDSDIEDLTIMTNGIANQLVLDSGGGIGIGTSSPDKELDVPGEVIIGIPSATQITKDIPLTIAQDTVLGDTQGDENLIAYLTGMSGTQQSGLRITQLRTVTPTDNVNTNLTSNAIRFAWAMTPGSANVNDGRAWFDFGSYHVSSFSEQAFRWGINSQTGDNDASATEWMRLNSAGLGIGVDPSATLDVVGTSEFNGNMLLTINSDLTINDGLLTVGNLVGHTCTTATGDGDVCIENNLEVDGILDLDASSDVQFVSTANTACSTQCGSNACLSAFALGIPGAILSNFVSCADATADQCFCSN